MLIVMKFGGSSRASASHIRRAAELILRQKKESGVVVVVSAQGSMTDELLRQAAEQTSRPAPREKERRPPGSRGRGSIRLSREWFPGARRG